MTHARHMPCPLCDRGKATNTEGLWRCDVCAGAWNEAAMALFIRVRDRMEDAEGIAGQVRSAVAGWVPPGLRR